MAEEERQITGGNRRPIQMVKQKERGWTKARRKIFLKILAETCNVSMAARAAGASASPYPLRRRDPAFAQLWDEALAIGYDRLEAMLLQRAIDGINDIDLGALLPEQVGDADTASEAGASDAAGAAANPRHRGLKQGRAGVTAGQGGTPRDDVQLALTMLARRRDRDGVRPNRGRKMMSSEEVDAMLLKKLDGLARKLKPKADPEPSA